MKLDTIKSAYNKQKHIKNGEELIYRTTSPLIWISIKHRSSDNSLTTSNK